MSDCIAEWTQDIHQGDAVETLSEMPESSVHCVVTSPPYWQMRDYGAEGQLGLEETPEEYVQNIVAVAEEIRRVLRSDGVWWLNLGDTYASKSVWGDQSDRVGGHDAGTDNRAPSVQRKQKMLMPHRTAIGLQKQGWIVRDDGVWYKTNGMPDPVKDRLREVKEFFFHITPEPQYWFDLDAVRVPHSEASIERSGRHDNTPRGYPGPEQTLDPDQFVHPNGANPGDVFEGPVAQFPDAHFAVFPEWLVEDPIKCSCPPAVCGQCGTPYERRVQEVNLWERDPEDVERRQALKALERFEESDLTVAHLEAARSVGFGDADHGDASQGSRARVDEETRRLADEAKEVLQGYFREFVASRLGDATGWEQACDCDTDETEPGIVLDPFAGAGTTCLVAKRLGRRFVGIDLNPEYVAMAQKRVGLTVDRPELLLEDGETALTAFADGGAPDGENGPAMATERVVCMGCGDPVAKDEARRRPADGSTRCPDCARPGHERYVKVGDGSDGGEFDGE